jgi:hypothetical protein
VNLFLGSGCYKLKNLLVFKNIHFCSSFSSLTLQKMFLVSLHLNRIEHMVLQCVRCSYFSLAW